MGDTRARRKKFLSQCLSALGDPFTLAVSIGLVLLLLILAVNHGFLSAPILFSQIRDTWSFYDILFSASVNEILLQRFNKFSGTFELMLSSRL